MPENEQNNPQSEAQPTRAGTVASDASDVKVVPPHFIRERVHTGHGNFAWSEPFDPIERAKADLAAEEERLKERGSFAQPEKK